MELLLFVLFWIILRIIVSKIIWHNKENQTIIFRNGTMRILPGEGKHEFLVQVRQETDGISSWVTSRSIISWEKAEEFAKAEDEKWLHGPK